MQHCIVTLISSIGSTHSAVGHSAKKGRTAHFGATSKLHPVDVVDTQGFANQLEGIWVLTEHQALLLRGYLAQPHNAPQQPFDLAHPVAYHLYLHVQLKLEACDEFTAMQVFDCMCTCVLQTDVSFSAFGDICSIQASP